MIIDVNAYYGHWPYWPVKGTMPASWMALLDRYGIDMVVVRSLRSIFLRAEDGNQEVCELAAQQTGRVLPLATVNEQNAPVGPGGADGWRTAGVRGLALCPLNHRYSAAERWLDTTLGIAEEMNWPVFISLRLTMNWGLPALPLEWVQPLLEQFPGVDFVVDAVNREWKAMIAYMEQFPRLHFGASCFQAPFGMEKLVEAVGHDRVLFSTGLPIQYPACGLARVQMADFSEEARAAILGQNAARLLGVSRGLNQ